VITNETLFTSFLANQRSVILSNPGYPDPFARGSTVAQIFSTYVAQIDQPLPRAYQATVGFQHEVASGVSVGADYVNSRGRDLIRIVDTNPVTPPTLTRPDPTRGFVRRLEGTGYSDYQGLLISGKSRFSRGVVQASYTVASYKTTTEAENALPQQDDFNIDDSYGYGNFDQRHRAVISGHAVQHHDRSRQQPECEHQRSARSRSRGTRRHLGHDQPGELRRSGHPRRQPAAQRGPRAILLAARSESR